MPRFVRQVRTERVLILSKQAAQWLVVRYDAQQRHAIAAREFRLTDAAGY